MKSTVLVILAVLVLLGTAPISTAQSDGLAFSMTQIAEDTYFFSGQNTTDDWVDGNSLAVVTHEGIVIVDAPNLNFVKRQISELKKITNQPVTYVINTHWHYDHIMGNEIYEAEFPNAKFIMQARGAQISDRRNPHILNAFFGPDRMSELVQEMRDSLASGLGDDGEPLTEYEATRTRRGIAGISNAYKGVEQVNYVSPDITFEKELVLKLGGKIFRLKHFQGHSLGDAVVYFENEKILATGDLIIHPAPYGIRSYFDRWVGTLDEIIDHPAEIIIPGHGDVLRDREYVKLQRNLIHELITQANEAVATGMSLEEYKEAFVSSQAYKWIRDEMAQGDPDILWGLENYFLAAGLDRAWAIARAEA